MNREDIRKLLGGYATGTLTPEEQEALFAAALEDQELFDALGREQALRDLLRDPAAKAELLAALDTPERAGFWRWLRRPLIAGLATAGVAAIAMLAVWQGTRVKQAPPPTIVAELKAPAPEMKATETKASDTKPPEAKEPETVRKTPARRQKADTASVQDSAATVPPAESVKTEIARAVNAPAPPPTLPAVPAPPPPAAIAVPTQPSSTAETVEVQALAPVQAPSVSLDKLTLDARSLFYGNSFVPAANPPVPPVVGGAQPQSTPKAAATAMRAATGNIARKNAVASSMGVRVSLLRGDQEAPVTTVLNPGEAVRLKLIPNEDGFLYVTARDGDAWKMVAGGPAQRLKPFETPPLPFTGSGQKQLYVMLSRQAQSLSPQALPGMARANLVETVSDQDRATYVVARLQGGPPQQVVHPITLTYR